MRKSTTSTQFIRRILFSLLALMGLGFLITRPSYLVSTERSSIYLYTSDYTSTTTAEDQKNKEHFSGVYDFLNSDRAGFTDTVHILGKGLILEELDLLEDYQIKFHPDKLLSGITRLEIPPITEGEGWTLLGDVRGEDVEEIYLNTPDGIRSEAILFDSTFALTSTAPTAGDYLLDIQVLLQEGDTIKDVLPVTVQHEPSWELLILSSFPSFEMNYLKNFWTAQGNGFTLRQQISTDRFQSTFVNTKTRNVDEISSRLINTKDFIITDVSSWNELSDRERTAILRSVRNEGLALIFRPSVGLTAVEEVRLPKMLEAREVQRSFASGDIPLLQYPTSGSSWTTISDDDVVNARYRTMGLGHVMILTIEDTYKLVLGDQEAVYQDLWSQIFSNLYRDFSPRAQLNHHNWIWEGESTDLQLLIPDELSSMPKFNDSISLPFLKVPFIDGVYEVSVIPDVGYQYISLDRTSDRLQFYAHKKGTWAAMQQKVLHRVNNVAVLHSEQKELGNINILKEYPSYWWYALVLIGFGGLWLDERLR